jgi:hypothetical protein
MRHGHGATHQNDLSIYQSRKGVGLDVSLNGDGFFSDTLYANRDGFFSDTLGKKASTYAFFRG